MHWQNTISLSQSMYLRTINPTEEQILADGWVEYVPLVETTKEEIVETPTYESLNNTVEIPVPEVSDKAAFVRARHKLRNKIQQYDSSSEVNIFYMGGVPMWLDKATRAGLMLRFQSEQAIGKEMTSLWYNGQVYELPLETAFQMLFALEVYASACYDNTQRHLAAVGELESIEQIEAYNYREGYPNKLEF